MKTKQMQPLPFPAASSIPGTHFNFVRDATVAISIHPALIYILRDRLIEIYLWSIQFRATAFYTIGTYKVSFPITKGLKEKLLQFHSASKPRRITNKRNGKSS